MLLTKKVPRQTIYKKLIVSPIFIDNDFLSFPF